MLQALAKDRLFSASNQPLLLFTLLIYYVCRWCTSSVYLHCWQGTYSCCVVFLVGCASELSLTYQLINSPLLCSLQAVIFIPTLNTVAVIVTMFFLLSYGVVNIACLALKFASAPNFRPTFQVYARYTCKTILQPIPSSFLCLPSSTPWCSRMLYFDVCYQSIVRRYHARYAVVFHTLTLFGLLSAVMVMLFIYLLLRAPATPWGDVSQALIYHQVR